MKCRVLRRAKVVCGIVLAGLCDLEIALGQAESQSGDELERGTGAEGAAAPCPTVSSPVEARSLSEENYRRYQTLSYIVGPDDPRAQEALRLYYCYHAQIAR